MAVCGAPLNNFPAENTLQSPLLSLIMPRAYSHQSVPLAAASLTRQIMQQPALLSQHRRGSHCSFYGSLNAYTRSIHLKAGALPDVD